jgi:hypothetical protein
MVTLNNLLGAPWSIIAYYFVRVAFKEIKSSILKDVKCLKDKGTQVAPEFVKISFV